MELENNVIDILKTIYDPEIPVDIFELGLIYEVKRIVQRDGSNVPALAICNSMESRHVAEELASQGQIIYENQLDPGTQLIMLAMPDKTQFFAFFRTRAFTTTLIGTCNLSYNEAPAWPYQSMAFCGTRLQRAALSLSGWLDHSTDTLTLQEYYTTPQTWGARYLETRGRTLVMRRR